LIKNFESTTNKWKKIITIVANNGHWEYLQNGPRSTRISVAHCIEISNKSILSDKNKTQWNVLGFDITRLDSPKFANTLYSWSLWNYKCFYGAYTTFHTTTTIRFHAQWKPCLYAYFLKFVKILLQLDQLVYKWNLQNMWTMCIHFILLV
jgi:hypothetical protein